MMQMNPANFLLSLAAALADAADASAGVVLGESLFVGQLPAGDDDQPRAVLRIYGGAAANEMLPVPAFSVQCMTQAMIQGDGLAFAWSLYAALFEASGPVRNHWAIPALTIAPETGAAVADASLPGGWDVRLVIPGGGPGVIGRDDAGRWEIVFNFDVRVSAPEP